MAFKLELTRCQWTVTEDGGYRFVLDTEQHPEDGWIAKVAFTSSRMTTELAAIRRLRDAAKKFLEMTDGDAV